MEKRLKILGFAGSLRSGSYNNALLRAGADLLPKDVDLDIFDIDGIPGFNQDIEADMPIKVKDFKSKIVDADAILNATPEYNYSVLSCASNSSIHYNMSDCPLCIRDSIRITVTKSIYFYVILRDKY